jgi:hypothetical protein
LEIYILKVNNNHENKIRFVTQLKKGDMINVFFYGEKIKSNCLVTEVIQDHYFEKGLIIYLNGTSRETMDLENQNGLWVEKA